MDTKDLKSFNVGSIRGLFIYIGDILIWPICKLVTWYDDVFKTTIANKYFDGNTELTNCDLGSITSLEEALFNTDVKRLDDLSKFTGCTTISYMCNNCTSLESMSCVFPDSVYAASGMFVSADSDTGGYIDAAECRRFRGFLSYSSIWFAPEIKFKHFTERDGEHYILVDDFFRGARQLRSIPKYDASGWYWEGGGFLGYSTDNYTYNYLTDIGGFTDFGFNYPSVTLFLGLCPNLTNQSVQNILDGLYSRAGTAHTSYVIFHNNVYNSITEDQLALAASKNWIIGSYPDD